MVSLRKLIWSAVGTAVLATAASLYSLQQTEPEQDPDQNMFPPTQTEIPF